MRSRSDSLPTRMPTSVSGMCDVMSKLHAGEMYAGRRLIRGSSRLLDRVCGSGEVEDPAAVRHEPSVVQGGAGVEDERADRLGVGDAVDGRAAVPARRILAARETDRDRRALRP